MSKPGLQNLDFRNTNSLWGSVLVATLARLGLRQAVVSPGSRSAPLTFAFARHPQIEAIPVLDERSAAFFALGLAKQHHRPVALVCTSGTAAANFFPAIIEAHESGAPLLVLTADRPPELRDCHSGQTIDQQKLYGGYVNFYHELAVPEPKLKLLRYLRQTMAHAYERALQPARGPVHLNCPFRDPLPPSADGVAEKFARGCDWAAFFNQLAPPMMVETEGPLPPFPTVSRGLVIAGPAQTSDARHYAGLVAAVAEGLGWPVLADALSPLRACAAENRNLVTTYDTILRNPRLAARLRPDQVICFGGWPVSKVLRAWLESGDAPVWLVGESAPNADALHARARHIRVARRVLAMQAIHLFRRSRQSAYCAAWLALERRARAALDTRLAATRGRFEGKAVWLLARHLPAETPVFIASSMPVRDAEYFWPAGNRGQRIFFNRGANGIDGTLSTALGVAHGNERAAVLLTGDLALLHDTNGFLLRPKFRGSLTVVLINNRGGGIFEHLPVAKFDPPFEEFVATPQEVDFAKLCAGYGVEHVAVRNWTQFTQLVSKLPKRGIRVLELRTDRKRDAAFRQRLFADVAAKLG